jgi:hypothetical protein
VYLWLADILREVFGDARARRILDVIGIVFGAIVFPVWLAEHQWWYAALAGAILVVSAVSFCRPRRAQPKPPA